MSNISRIKSLMMISEQQKIVAPSVNIDALITMLLSCVTNIEAYPRQFHA